MKEIVIKMPDVVYEYLVKRIKLGMNTEIDRIIYNGKVLPKGHHELIDRYDLMNAYRGSNNIFEALQKTDVIVEADKEDTE